MKLWKDLKLTDDYLFSQIMREEDFCKLFLEMLMNIRIEKVVYLEAQKEVNLFPQAKGIRMDVYLEGDGEIYNIEMQTVRKTNLVKRMRYYHSAIDVDSLLRGNPYDQLKKSFVIFICNFDLCGDGFPVYESQTVWKQNGKETGDEQVKIVYNIGAFEKADDPKLKALLRYLSTETVTDEARTLAEKVAAFKRHFPDGRPHMKYELDLYDKWCEGKEEGIKEGRQEGLSEGIQKGRKEGRDEGILQIAAAALKQGVPLETVAAFTGLTPTRLEELQRSL
ncbi:MAG: Rpn family recombination-promoting nuclease/putative transposase [Spirochaetia bacterium]|nr:Rpn family recombination-promoting nuclease/putative transposase [Spirochaetia bacterium]